MEIKIHKFWLSSVTIAAIIAGCYSGDLPPELSDDRMHFLNTLLAFGEANEISLLPEGMTRYKPPPGADEKVGALLAKALQEGGRISVEFLDWLH